MGPVFEPCAGDQSETYLPPGVVWSRLTHAPLRPHPSTDAPDGL